jgi:aryl-alcohol dehydrogenase-like predicted oxidoreductase
LKSDGSVKKIGISIYDTSELDLLCERFQFDLIQAPFNIFDRRLIYSGWMERLALQGVELHVRSAFLQGLLLMSANDRPNKFSPWSKLFLEWDGWLKLNKLLPLEACLSYVLSFPHVSKVIVGADSLVQLKEIILASSCKFSLFPEGLMTRDTALINPANWATLSGSTQL